MELMKRFYKKMPGEGQTASAALRGAQVEMWKQERWSAPYFERPLFLGGLHASG